MKQKISKFQTKRWVSLIYLWTDLKIAIFISYENNLFPKSNNSIFISTLSAMELMESRGICLAYIIVLRAN